MEHTHTTKPKAPKDYLVFALDVPRVSEATEYIHLLKNHVGMFKVGLELFVRGGRRVIDTIHESGGGAKIFLDLKLYDIPATVYRTMNAIAAMGVDFATVHCSGQKDMLSAAQEGADGKVGVLGVTVLTSMSADDVREAGYGPEYVDDISRLVMKRAAAAAEWGFAGIVCSPLEVAAMKERFGRGFLAVTPGIRPAKGLVSHDDQSRISTPAQAIRNGADYLVVGRPIREPDDSKAAADAICKEIEEALK